MRIIEAAREHAASNHGDDGDVMMARVVCVFARAQRAITLPRETTARLSPASLFDNTARQRLMPSHVDAACCCLRAFHVDGDFISPPPLFHAAAAMLLPKAGIICC